VEGQPSDPPGAVSDQNGEEGESGLREDRAHPEPRTTGRPASRRTEREDGPDGAAGEGSQSTGDPRSAG
jgi:hypothetical protein